MRSLILSMLAICLFLSSCKSKNTTATVTSDDGKTTTTVDTKGITQTSNDMQVKMNELKKLTPLTIEELKATLPEQLAGIKRSTFSANSAMGFAVGEAEYKKDDSTHIKLTVYDCAGEAGSSIYALNYWTKMSMESESDNGYTKKVDFMGKRAVETYEKNNNSYMLTYTANERLLVTLQGQNIGLDNLRDAAKSLNLK